MSGHLTAKQQQIRILVALGLAAKEIASRTGNTIHTINTHIKNIKVARNLQKASEIAADYWCEKIGTSLEEQRKQILASCICIVFVLNFWVNIDTTPDKRRFRLRCRRENIESVETYDISA